MNLEPVLQYLERTRRILLWNTAWVQYSKRIILSYVGTRKLWRRRVWSAVHIRFLRAAFTSTSSCRPILRIFSFCRMSSRTKRLNISLTHAMFLYTQPPTLPNRSPTFPLKMFLRRGCQEGSSGELRFYCIPSHRGRAGRPQGRRKGDGNRGV